MEGFSRTMSELKREAAKRITQPFQRIDLGIVRQAPPPKGKPRTVNRGLNHWFGV